MPVTYPTMREYAASTPYYAYFGECEDWRLVGATHRDDDSLGRAWWEVKQRIIRAGLAELRPGEDESEYMAIETDSHFLVGHASRLLVSSDIPPEIVDALEAFDKKCEDYALPSSKAFGYIDAEEIHSEIESNDALDTAEAALYELGVPSEIRRDVAPFVLEWACNAGGHEDPGYGGYSDWWPSKDAQFYGYLAYRRYKRAHPEE